MDSHPGVLYLVIAPSSGIQKEIFNYWLKNENLREILHYIKSVFSGSTNEVKLKLQVCIYLNEDDTNSR